MSFDFLASSGFWQYASIPLVAALVGWSTNWLAIQFTFFPVHFIGIPPYLGWQGIIPSKAEKMAEYVVDSTLAKLGSLSEITAQLEPDVIAAHIAASFDPWVPWYTRDILFAEYPRLYKLLPERAKEVIYERVRRSLPEFVSSLMDEVEHNIEDLLDMKEMVVSHLKKNRRLLNRIFLECGEKEFKFIVNSGFAFGLLFGLVQMVVWMFLPKWWVLPLFGLVVGWATNWIALNIIFRPVDPIQLGPIRLQGIFLKRQNEASAIWCRIVTEEVITVRNLFDAMLRGSRADETRRLIAAHVDSLVDDTTSAARQAVDVPIVAERIASIKEAITAKVIEVSKGPFNDPVFAEGRREVINDMLLTRMRSLSPREFQELLRPAFQEDEWKLVLIGAVLGMVAGFAQLVFVFT